jgi:hypothetical protein
MIDLSRFGIILVMVLAGCSEGVGGWGGQITETDGVVRIQNPAAPLAGSGEISADLLWSSAGPAEGDYWEAPNWVHAGDEVVFVVDRQASKIHRLSPEGAVLSSFGEPGEGPGQYRRIIDAIPTGAGLFVIDGGNGRVEILGSGGEILASSLLGQVVFSIVPLGEDAVAVSGILERDLEWQRIDAAAKLEEVFFPEFIDPDTSEAAPSRPGRWDGKRARLRYTSPQIQVFSDTGALEKVVDVPLPTEEATDQEIEGLVAEMATVLAEDGLPSGVIQQQADQLRSRPRAKRRFRDLRFDRTSGLAAIWEQNPEDFGSGNASLHVLSTAGIYLGVLEFHRAWSAFDLKNDVLYALSRDPETDLVTLEAFSLSVASEVLERADRLAGGSGG